MPVAMAGATGTAEALAAIHAGDEVAPGLEEPLWVAGVHHQIREVEGPPHHHLAAVALLPGLAAIAGAEQGAAGGFHK